jgi:hypothetical protein
MVEAKFAEEQGRRARFFVTEANYLKHRSTYVKIWNFLEGLRGEFKNSMEQLVEDYLTSIYKRWSFHKKVPFISHLSPSSNNEKGFFMYIQELEEFYSEPYWTEHEPNVSLAKRTAKEHTKGGVAEVCDLNIVDV